MNINKKWQIILIILAVVLIVGIFYFFKTNHQKSSPPVPIIQKKLFVPPERNYDNIQHEDLRKQIDPKFNTLADELSEAYYNYWKYGESHPWQGYDVQNNQLESKELFDKLQGLIWNWYDIKFHDLNMSYPEGQRVPEREYNYFFDADGNVRAVKTEIAKNKIKELEQEGISINIE